MYRGLTSYPTAMTLSWDEGMHFMCDTHSGPNVCRRRCRDIMPAATARLSITVSYTIFHDTRVADDVIRFEIAGHCRPPLRVENCILLYRP